MRACRPPSDSVDDGAACPRSSNVRPPFPPTVPRGGKRFQTIVRIAGLLVALILLAPQTARAVTFHADVAVPMPPDFINASGIDLAASSDEVRIMWSGQLVGLNGFDWAYAVSHTAGTNFEAFRSPFSTQTSAFVENRVVALSDGTFAYMWNEQGGTLQIAVERQDGTFAGAFSPLSGTSIESDFDAIALGTDLLIIWSDTSAGIGELRIGQFTGPDFRLASWQTIDDDPATVKVEPRIAHFDNETFAAWRRSDVNGSSIMFSHGRLLDPWPSPLSASGGAGPNLFHPDLAVHGNGTVLVAFEDFSGTGFPVNGAFVVPPYTSSFRFNLGAAIGGLLPTDLALATDETDRLLVSWLDGDPQTQTGAFQVMYADSEDWTVFSQRQRIDSGTTQVSKDAPVLIAEKGRVFVVWGDRRGSGDTIPYIASTLTQPPSPPRPPNLAPLFAALGFIVAAAVVATAWVVVGRRRRAPAPGAGGTPPIPVSLRAVSAPPGWTSCAQCGTLNQAGFLFCFRCGWTLGGPPPGPGA